MKPQSSGGDRSAAFGSRGCTSEARVDLVRCHRPSPEGTEVWLGGWVGIHELTSASRLRDDTLN